MIPIEHYSFIYYIGLALLILLFGVEVRSHASLQKIPSSKLTAFSFFLLAYTIFFIGLRDPYASSLYLGDTGAYTNYFETINDRDLSLEKEYGFYYLMKIFHPFGVQSFYFFCALVYVILPYLTLKKLLGKYAYFALAMIVTSMSFWGFGINGLRNGLATSIFIFSFRFYPKKILMFSIMWFSTLFHNTMYLPLLCFLLTFLIKNSKKLLVIWGFAILFSLFLGERINDLTQTIFQWVGFQSDRTDSLFLEVKELEVFKGGFRLDFLIYSSLPIIMGYYFIYKRNFQDKLYLQLYNTYIISNAIWIVVMYAPFTNRTAYLSWFLMPILIVYPLLKENFLINKKLSILTCAIIFSLIFSLIMQFK